MCFYRNLRRYLGLPEAEPTVCDVIQQLALPGQDIVERLRGNLVFGLWN